MVSLVLTAVSAAFLDVGVVLALVAVLVLVLGPRCHGAGDLLRRRPQLGPVLGALLGLTPGCSGALLVTPLFLRGHVSLGTLVATLVATTGDSAWALWTGAPRTALVVHGVLLALGVVVGVVVDLARSAPVGRFLPQPLAPPVPPAVPSAVPSAVPPAVPSAVPPPVPSPVRSTSTTTSAGRVRVVAVVGLLAGFWGTTVAGAAFVLGGGSAPGDGAALDATQLVGLVGFVACVALLVRARGRYTSAVDHCAGSPRVPAGRSRRLLRTLDGAASQAAFVVVWVGAAYALLAAVEAALGAGAGLPELGGAVGVLVGAGVGALPGCGLQIAWTGLYLDGGIDLPSLLANAAAQDGDALLPLLVLHRRLALQLTALTTVPALLLGGAAVTVLG